MGASFSISDNILRLALVIRNVYSSQRQFLAFYHVFNISVVFLLTMRNVSIFSKIMAIIRVYFVHFQIRLSSGENGSVLGGVGDRDVGRQGRWHLLGAFCGPEGCTTRDGTIYLS